MTVSVDQLFSTVPRKVVAGTQDLRPESFRYDSLCASELLPVQLPTTNHNVGQVLPIVFSNRAEHIKNLAVGDRTPTVRNISWNDQDISGFELMWNSIER